MSGGRVENLAALMAAILVVLKTGDMPQKLRPCGFDPSDNTPYGLYSAVARQLGIKPTNVYKAMSGLVHAPHIVAAVEEARQTFVGPRQRLSLDAIRKAVAAECGVSPRTVDSVTRGTSVSKLVSAALIRHGWRKPIPLAPQLAEGFPPLDRRLINFAELARTLNISPSFVTEVAHGRAKSARVHAAIAEAIAAAKQKQAAQ